MTDQELYALVIQEIAKSISSFFNISYLQVLTLLSHNGKVEGLRYNHQDCLIIAEHTIRALNPLVEMHRLTIGDVLFKLHQVL